MSIIKAKLRDEIKEYEERDINKIVDFNNFLDETHEWPKIGNLSFKPSDVLKLDEPAYNEAYNNWADEKISELKEELENMEDEEEEDED